MLEYLASGDTIALLDVNPGLVIWTTITFTIVLVVLKKFAWTPITSALDARAEKIHADIERAEQIKNDAEKKLEEYTSKLNALREEGKTIIAEARTDGERVKQEILETSRREAEAIKSRGMREVELAMDTALQKFHHDVADLSVAVASQILGRSMTKDDHARLIEESIQKFRSLN